MSNGSKGRGARQVTLALDRAKPKRPKPWHVLLPPPLRQRIDALREQIYRAATISDLSYPQMIEWLVCDSLRRLEEDRSEGGGSSGGESPPGSGVS